MDRAAELRSDYELLGRLLTEADGSGAAAIARERRLIAVELERIETPEEVALVDQLAERRARAGSSHASTRRRQSG